MSTTSTARSSTRSAFRRTDGTFGEMTEIASEFGADVVVVGGGGSGMAAAIEAKRLGRDVILIEKNPVIGGSTIRSIGSISASATPHQIKKGIKDTPDEHFEDLGKFNEVVKGNRGEDNPALRRILVDNGNDS